MFLYGLILLIKFLKIDKVEGWLKYYNLVFEEKKKTYLQRVVKVGLEIIASNIRS